LKLYLQEARGELEHLLAYLLELLYAFVDLPDVTQTVLERSHYLLPLRVVRVVQLEDVTEFGERIAEPLAAQY
jgi:hypothetical protein